MAYICGDGTENAADNIYGSDKIPNRWMDGTTATGSDAMGKGPKYLIRDRDKKYAMHFSAVEAGIKELKTPFRTPQANGIYERFMGSLHRECLDHILIHEGRHLERGLRNIRRTSIKNDRIRALLSAFPIIMNCQSQSQQAAGSHRRKFLMDYTIAIPALYIWTDPYLLH